MPFLHEFPDAKALFEVVADEMKILPILVEKDYWLMHCLWGLQKANYSFELKGGTSLSKGFGIINRFSEDIDIQIHPDQSAQLKTGKNHDKTHHIKEREQFFDSLAKNISINGFKFHRDHQFDEPKKMRSAGIRGEYNSFFSSLDALKPGVLLELGFDQTTPYEAVNISSWALEKALALNLDITNNMAVKIKCYYPEYTFVEKLQTISTKYRQQQLHTDMPINFLRHYYDISQLLSQKRVLNFIGTSEYKAHKEKRFRTNDEKDIRKNEAFILSNPETRARYTNEFEKKSAIYFAHAPHFSEILNKIQTHLSLL